MFFISDFQSTNWNVKITRWIIPNLLQYQILKYVLIFNFRMRPLDNIGFDSKIILILLVNCLCYCYLYVLLGACGLIHLQFY